MGQKVFVRSQSVEEAMRYRETWLKALVIMALAAWRLSTPATAEALTSACGRTLCVSDCSEGSYHCDGCPGWTCQESPTILCVATKTLTCDSDS